MPEVIFKYNNQKINLAQKQDVINPNLAYGNVKTSDDSKILGSVNDFTLTSNSATDNWCFCKIPLNTSIKKGDVITISALATLSGPNATDGYYKAAIFNKNTSYSFDPAQDTAFLKSGIRSSKTFVSVRNSDPDDPPILLIYTGKAEHTALNTIHVRELKVEHGSIATSYIPAVEDLVLKSDYESLKEEIDQIKSKMGGVKLNYRLYYAISKEVA